LERFSLFEKPFSTYVSRDMWPIVRDALVGASPTVRTEIWLVIAAWVTLVLLQVWDSRNAEGPAGVAEFLSAMLGASGMALLGTAHTLQRTMEETSERQSPNTEGHDALALQQVLLALPAVGFSAGVALGAASVLMVLRGLLGAEIALAAVGTLVYGGMVFFAARTVNSSARTLFDFAARQAGVASDARSEAAAAQLAALQARMNPHFLFNALNTVAALVRSDPPAAERVVESLSGVLRRTLQRAAGKLVTVDDEVEYVRDYLALEQERWGSRLRIHWDVDAAARALEIPPLVLQPIVENALKYGVGARVEGGTVQVTIRRGASLVVRVDDDGEGFPPGWREGTGLGNLRERLRTLYGPGASLDVETDTAGAHVTVTLPMDKG
jgi:signal transduction histidine kinase